MTQRVQVIVECDPCQHDEPEQLTPAVTRHVIVDGAAYEIDTCDLHGKQIDVLAEWLADVGRPAQRQTGKTRTKSAKPAKPASTSTSDERLPCPADGCDYVAMTTAALGSHAMSVHEQSLGELRGDPIITTCDECGRGFTTNQGLAVHKHRSHNQAARVT